MADRMNFVVDITDLGAQSDVVSRRIEVTSADPTEPQVLVVEAVDPRPADPDNSGRRYEVGPFSGPQGGSAHIVVSNIDDAGNRNPTEQDITKDFDLPDNFAPTGPNDQLSIRITGEDQETPPAPPESRRRTFS